MPKKIFLCMSTKFKHFSYKLPVFPMDIYKVTFPFAILYLIK